MAAMTHYEPSTTTPLALRDMVNRLFEDAFVWPRWATGAGAFGWPAGMSLYETEDAYVGFIAVPGLKPADLELTVQHQVLTIRGKSSLAPPEGARPIWTGLQGGQIEQQVQLPGEVDADAVEAQVQDGILMLRLPKAAHQRAHRIAVKTA